MSENRLKDLKQKWYIIIFQHDTRKGRLFDLVLIWLILISAMVVLIESSSMYDQKYHGWLLTTEWIITLIFTAEYIARIWVYPNRKQYVLSFYGVIDLLSIIPTYLSLIIAGSQALIMIRLLRILRIFRVLKLTGFMRAGMFLVSALRNSREKITVFFGAVLILVSIVGTIMYLVEGPESGFTSIPLSIYWAIVTITTVGYGDISPGTAFGQFIASVLMLTGYAIIAVPTGILTSEIATSSKNKPKAHMHRCKACGYGLLPREANYCSHCGTSLHHELPQASEKTKDIEQ